MNNGCPECKKIKGLCLDCQIAQADWEAAVAMGRLETLKKMKKIKEQEHDNRPIKQAD